MPDTGFLAPTAAINASGPDADWSNPANVIATDAANASVTAAAGAFSDFLMASGFGFSIPAGNVLTGWAARVTGTLPGDPILQAFLTKDTVGPWGFGEFFPGSGSGFFTAGADGNINQSVYPVSNADAAASTFGVGLVAQGDVIGGTVDVENLKLKLFYAVPPTGTVARIDWARFPNPRLRR